MTLSLTDINSTSCLASSSTSGGADYELIHGWVLWACWFILGLIMVLSNRYMKVFWRVHMWIHRISGFLIFGGTIALSALLIKDIGGIEDNVHSIIGIVILGVVIFITLFGIFTRSRMENMKWNTKWILRIKNLHKVRIILFLV
jgi:hypothetical protein